MNQSIAQRCNALPNGVGAEDLRALLTAMHQDTLALQDALAAVTAKLDTDGGVTATDFAATATPTLVTRL